MTDLGEMKARAAERALEYVTDGMIVGLGTGSTAKHMVRLLSERVRKGLKVRGVATSIATETLAREGGIPMTTLTEHPEVDVVIDGADEVDPKRDLIKGAGGALVREKVVAAASRHRVIIVDSTKLVPVLGTRFPVPVEVIPLAVGPVKIWLTRLGATVETRLADGKPYVTDNGNWILDARFGEIREAARLEQDVTMLPGVVDCGLFVGMNPTVVVAMENETRILR